MNSQEHTGTLSPADAGPAKRFGWFALVTGKAPTLRERRRAFRVWLLVATIVVLSAADLYMTLTHLRSVGMGEANPLARLIISYNSPMILSLWKGACVLLACLILVLARFRRSGEIACWVSCAVLTILTVHWAQYSAEASAFTSQINDASRQEKPANWVSMGTE